MNKIGFVGGGKMASAIIGSLLAGGTERSRLMVSDRLAACRELHEANGIETTADNAFLARSCDMLVLCVKPQQSAEALAELSKETAGKVIVTIMAGVTTGRVLAQIAAPAAIIRVMPNTPMLLGKGTIAVAFGSCGESVKADVRALFARCGRLFEVSESQLDAVTALSGSGPAYFYRFAKVLAEAAARLGLEPDMAEAMAVSTMEGAAAMMLESGRTSAQLIKDVSSPGGTTLAALDAFDRAGLDAALAEGVIAAEKRSKELGAI